MTLSEHYLNEDVAKSLITIPIAAASLDTFIENALTIIDARINGRCFIATNTTNVMDKASLGSIEYNAFLKLLQNQRLSKEGIPAEIDFIDSWFSAEDKFLIQDVRNKNKFVAAGHQNTSEL